MKTCFICVNYNSTNYALDFVKSIRDNSLTASIIVVDNSIDDSYYGKLLPSFALDDKVKLIRQNVNSGYFSALNFGLSFVDKNQIIVVCNNDLIFKSDFLNQLENSTYADDVAVICPNVITLSGRHQNPHVRNRMSKLAILKLDLYYSNFYIASLLNFIYTPLKKLVTNLKKSVQAESCYLHMGIGACYIIKPIFWKHYSELHFPFFLYGEEAYLSNQVHSIGYKLYYDSKLIISHAESGTLSLLPKRKTYEFAKEGYSSYRQYL